MPATHLRKMSLFCLGCTLGLLLSREPARRKEPYGFAKCQGVGKPSLHKKRVQIRKGLLTTKRKSGTGDHRPQFKTSEGVQRVAAEITMRWKSRLILWCLKLRAKNRSWLGSPGAKQ